MAFLNVPLVRGEVIRQRVPIGELADGTAVTLPVMTVTGTKDGPTLYLQAGLHGDEMTGIEICRLALAKLSPKELAGAVVAVPVANPPAHLTRTRGFLHEERWLIDINRIFPGSAHGLLSERIAHTLLSEFVGGADYSLDLHCGLDGCNIAPLVYVNPYDDEHGTLGAREKMAMAFGTELLYYKPRGAKLGTSEMSRSLANQADLAGKPLLSAERGESRRVTQEFVPIGVRGVFNVLKVLGMLPGKPEVPEHRIKFTTVHLVHASRGGGLRVPVALGAEVKRGQVIAEVVDVFGTTIEELASPVDGILLRKMLLGMINTGAEIAWVVN